MNSDTVRAALLLSNRLVRLDVAPLKAREFWTVLDRTNALGIEVGQLLSEPERCDDVAGDSTSTDPAPNPPPNSAAHPPADPPASPPPGAVTGDRLRALLDATRAFAFEVERLEEAGIHIISALDNRFPPLLRDRMEHGCPPHAFAAGDLSSAQRPTLSIIGESNSSEDVRADARNAVAAAVVAGWSIATGDSAANNDDGGSIAATVIAEAIACEASLLVLAATGINRAAREPDLRRLVQASAVCLLSPFSPDAAASAATTRARNAMLHAVGTLTLVTSCHDGTGQIWSTAFDAVQREPASVVVVTGPNAPAGNQALAALGAQQLANISELPALLA